MRAVPSHHWVVTSSAAAPKLLQLETPKNTFGVSPGPKFKRTVHALPKMKAPFANRT